MPTDYRRTKSRLARYRSKLFLRQTVVFLVLALGVIFAAIRFGVPLLIKLAVFIGDWRGSGREAQSERVAVLVPPTLQTLPEATFSARLDISGFAQEGVLVTVFINANPQKDVVADSQGEFVLSDASLKQGKNRVWAVARDGSGNESQESKEMVVVVDSEPPQLTLDSPEDGVRVSETQVTVNGLVDEDANITINGQFVVPKSDGSFSKTVNLQEGENILSVVARDAAGNETTKTVKVTYTPL